MKRFPAEFAELLSPRGRRVLAGKDKELSSALTRVPFLASTALIDPTFAAAAHSVLAKAFGDLLVPLSRALPASDSAKTSGGDLLPKVARSLTTPMSEDKTAPAYLRAEACGLITMLGSRSYFDFAQALSGRSLEGPATAQVLCVRPGDYAGPHADHHPESERARGGYTDVHLTFCSPGVQRQLLVYEREGHFNDVVSISETGGITAYRLPVWHYTTPLEGKPKARRWIVMGSFLDRSP